MTVLFFSISKGGNNCSVSANEFVLGAFVVASCVWWSIVKGGRHTRGIGRDGHGHVGVRVTAIAIATYICDDGIWVDGVGERARPTPVVRLVGNSGEGQEVHNLEIPRPCGRR